jgi:hypothetical protein
MTTRMNELSAVAVAATLTTLLATSSAFAAGSDGISKGGTPVKHPANPIVNTIHPIVRHPPLHGAGSSHNPIIAPTRDCDDPSTLCRRP